MLDLCTYADEMMCVQIIPTLVKLGYFVNWVNSNFKGSICLIPTTLKPFQLYIVTLATFF